MNMTFGAPTTDNPRPFKCDDCKIAFRIHGHLAKHLRSKMHIMKLECLGKLPFGTYAEIERSGANLNEIDTTDCESSLESLQIMARRLADKVPVPRSWPRERTVSGGSCDDHSDGVPYTESPIGTGGPAVVGPSPFHAQSMTEESCVSPDFGDAGRLVVWSQRTLESQLPSSPDTTGVAARSVPGVKPEPSETSDVLNSMSTRPNVGRRDACVRPGLGQRTSSMGSLVQDYEDISDEEGEPVSVSIGCVCRICGKILKSAKFLQLHMYVDHVNSGGTCPKVIDDFTPPPVSRLVYVDLQRL